MFRFYLDNTLVNDPIDWDGFTEVIERDETTKALLFKYDVRLSFAKDGYQYLKAKKDSEGYCSSVSIQIDYQCSDGGAWSTQLKGTIYISDVVFKQGKSCIAECSVEDDNFTALIFNNKNIQVMIPDNNTWTSKNGVSIVGCRRIIATHIFDPGDGLEPGLSPSIFAYALYNIFGFLVRFLTDNRMGFASDYLDYTKPVTTAKERVRYLILWRGVSMRFWDNSTGSPPIYTSFEDLFNEVNKLYPIGIIIERDSTGKPILRIEDEDYFKDATPILSISDIAQIDESFDNTLLYSQVSIDSEVADYGGSIIHSYVAEDQNTWAPENYFLEGQCNIDRSLSLNSQYILDSNIIEELMFSNRSNTGYDDKVIFMEARWNSGAIGSDDWTAIQTANGLPSSPGTYRYNDNLLNVNVLNRRVWGADVYFQPELVAPDLIISSDFRDYMAARFKFEYPISYEDYTTVRNSLTSPVLIGTGQATKKVWLQRVERNIKTSQMTWETISNQSI